MTSGAGKTVSAKYIMRYFATADDKDTVGKATKEGGVEMTEVEEQILGMYVCMMQSLSDTKTDHTLFVCF
jgi:myosin-5